mmetsp:Transcript_13568/g.31696  ORF Transcript_13568/g.31696 Transcript_13568/m.31696 type:complete len:263 (+) Transcript_13568:277-1065(+)
MFCPGTRQPDLRVVSSHGRRCHDWSIYHQHHERRTPPRELHHVRNLHAALYSCVESVHQPAPHCHTDGSPVHCGRFDLSMEDLCHFAIRAPLRQRRHSGGHDRRRLYQPRHCHCGRDHFVGTGTRLGQRCPRRGRRGAQGHDCQWQAGGRRQVRARSRGDLFLVDPQVCQHVSHWGGPKHGRFRFCRRHCRGSLGGGGHSGAHPSVRPGRQACHYSEHSIQVRRSHAPHPRGPRQVPRTNLAQGTGRGEPEPDRGRLQRRGR